MSKLDELINELCPDGVEYRTISEICNIHTPPMKIVSKDILENGDFPVIDQGATYISGYTNDKTATLPENQYIVFGDHTENIKYVDFSFAQGADGVKILTTAKCNPKYFYYCFLNYYVKTGRYTRHWSVAKVTFVPIPPLPVQKEIVRILDNFTELAEELTKELTARKKQYEYYRNELLTFGDDVQWQPLDSVSNVIDSLHQTPSYVKDGLSMIRVTDIKGGYIDLDVAYKVDKETFQAFIKKYAPQKDDLVMSRVGSYGNVSIVPSSNIVCMGQNTVVIIR